MTEQTIVRTIASTFKVPWPSALTDAVLRRMWQLNADRNYFDWSWRMNAHTAHFLGSPGHEVRQLYGQPVEIDNTLDAYSIYAGKVYATLVAHITEVVD